MKDANDVQLAFDRWMERDIKFAKIIKKNAEELGYKVIVVDGTKSTEQLMELIID